MYACLSANGTFCISTAVSVCVTKFGHLPMTERSPRNYVYMLWVCCEFVVLNTISRQNVLLPGLHLVEEMVILVKYNTWVIRKHVQSFALGQYWLSTVVLRVKTKQHFRKHNNISENTTFQITEKVGFVVLIVLKVYSTKILLSVLQFNLVAKSCMLGKSVISMISSSSVKI